MNKDKKIFDSGSNSFLIELLNDTSQNLPVGILAVYADRRDLHGFELYYINNTMLEYLEYSRLEFEAKFTYHVENILYPSDLKKICESIDDALKCDGDRHLYYRMTKKDGSYIWFVERLRKIRTKDDRLMIIGTYLDVTETINKKNQFQQQSDIFEELTEELISQRDTLEAQAKALAISEERLRIALDKTSNIVFDFDVINNSIIYSSNTSQCNTMFSVYEAKTKLIVGGEITDSCLDKFNNMFLDIINGEHQSECVVKIKLCDSKQIWNKISLSSIIDSNGNTVRAIGIIEDITKQKEAEIAYAREEQYRQAILSHTMASYVINFTKDEFESCVIDNPLCVPVEIGTSYEKIIEIESHNHLTDIDRLAYLNMFSKSRIINAFKNGEMELSLDYSILKPDMTSMWMRTTLRLVLDTVTNEMKGFMYINDIDSMKRAELDLMRKSEYDAMTDVYNKGATISRIKDKLRIADELQTNAFMMLDVDNFKTINDTYGHPFGDKILVDVAKVLTRNSLEGDIIGRLGGDEFCIFISSVKSAAKIAGIAKKICMRVNDVPLPEINKFEPALRLSCSVGISMCRGNLKTFDQIYKEADRALYKVKRSGRNNYAFADPLPAQ